MPREAAPLGRCPICGEPLKPGEQFFNNQYHEKCLPDCANCGKSVQWFSCDRVWQEDGKWKARHETCP